MNPIYHFIARQYIIRQNHQNCEQFSMKAIARDVACSVVCVPISLGKKIFVL